MHANLRIVTLLRERSRLLGIGITLILQPVNRMEGVATPRPVRAVGRKVSGLALLATAELSKARIACAPATTITLAPLKIMDRRGLSPADASRSRDIEPQGSHGRR